MKGHRAHKHRTGTIPALHWQPDACGERMNFPIY